MKGKITVHQVAGKQYEVWSDFIMRGTFAKDESGDIRQIKWNGYVSNELSIRKAIANHFNLSTFRK